MGVLGGYVDQDVAESLALGTHELHLVVLLHTLHALPVAHVEAGGEHGPDTGGAIGLEPSGIGVVPESHHFFFYFIETDHTDVGVLRHS